MKRTIFSAVLVAALLGVAVSHAGAEERYMSGVVVPAQKLTLDATEVGGKRTVSVMPVKAWEVPVWLPTAMEKQMAGDMFGYGLAVCFTTAEGKKSLGEGGICMPSFQSYPYAVPFWRVSRLL